MVLRILYVVFIVVLVRFVFRLARALVGGASAGKPAAPGGPRRDAARPGAGRVIDVEYTEQRRPPRRES